MVSKNNQWQHLQVSAQRVPHYGLRKLSVGVASVLLSTTLYMGVSAHADTVTTPSETSTPATTATTPSPSSTEMTSGAAGSSNGGTPSNSVSETPTSQGTPEKSGAGSGSADSNGATPVQPAATAAPTAKPVAGDETPKVGSETSASNVTQSETVNSQWIIHYVNQADHKQELKDPTVITLQYTRTNTSQSDGTTKYGDWSYVSGSYKQTGTPITVNDGDNPVKQDNIDKDGENMDSFTIIAMYPTVAGYTMHNNINGTRLHDYLRNNDRQADTMSKDFYAEYDVAKSTHETVTSQWTIHYVNSADHKQELKAPTVITMQYTRTNTLQSNGTVQYGDWSYVPGSFKQTGTLVEVNGSDNPVKEDNVDNNGRNEDVFSIIVKHPNITGYELHNGTNGVRLSDYLLNDESNGEIQAPTMSKDGYVEYDVAKERSVTVKFVDSQYFNQQVGQAITLTGRDGDTVKVNVTVPDKYQLANGQQLPTTYTFTAGSGDVTIHLVHKVVQREATVNVKLGMITGVDIEGVDGTRETITQERWRQLGEEFNSGSPAGFFEILPSVEVGTLTGHVNYDVVDSKVVSFGDDWTTLNLGGHAYQLPNGVDVVNGVLIDSDDGSFGKPLREYYLKHYSIINLNHSVDPDYATRPWYGYLSVNTTNDSNGLLAEWNDLGLQGGLVGNEPNALAKANGDRVATSVEMTNKTIDVSLLDNPNVFSEQDGRLQATLPVPVVGVYVPYVEKMVTRTINITTPDGKTTTVKQTVTLEKQVDLGKDVHRDWTTGEWANYDVPTIPGYTASQSNVAKETVTGTTKDQTVNITYTAGLQTATVVYQTEDGTPVHTTTVNGQTGQTVKVSNEVPAGWKIINGKVPSEITFGPNGTPQTVVTIAHQHVNVKPDAPKTTNDHLPDNSGKTYPVGVSESDLNKTITGTIKITMPDGQVKTVLKTAKLTRTANVDEVTGEVKYSDWTTGYWSAYTAPVVPGYTADYPYIADQSVTDTTKDQTIEITYMANPQTTHVNYVDAQGNLIHVTTVNGQTNQTVKVSSEIPDGWKLVDGQTVPTTITFGPDGHADMSVKIEHQHVTVTPDKPQNNGTKLPDNPAKTFSGVETNDLNKTITRTIKVTTPDGKTTMTKQTAKLTRTADVDEVTGEVTYGNWTTGEWAAYDVPSVAGYTPSQTTVAKEGVTAMSKDTAVEITYLPMQHQISVEYVDDDDHGKIVKTDRVPGKTDQTITVTPSAPANYDLVDNGNRTYTVTSDDAQAVQIHVKHHQVTTSESKTVTRTINVHTPHDGTKTIKQNAELTRKVTTDQVTGEKIYGGWSAATWDRYAVPAVAGYVPSIGQVAQQVVNGTTMDQTIDVTYSSGEHTTHINYVDKDGNIVHTTTIKGQTDGTAQVPNETPAGWMVIGEPVPTELAFGPDGHADVTVTVAHQHVTVTPDQPKTPTDKLPDNPSKTYPNGVGRDDLNKIVTRTIKVTTPDGQTKTVAQTAKLTRTADVDEVTGKVTYGKWTTGEWSSYEVPVVPGYTASQSEVSATKVTDNAKDQTVTVTYMANDQTTHINYVDGNGKIVHTTTVTGKTGQTVKVPNEVPAGWTITSGQVPSDVTFGANGHDDVTVTVARQHVTVTPDQPQPDGTPLPDNPSQHFTGVESGDLNKTITRTIVFNVPGQNPRIITQTAKLTRTATVDEVTGAVTYGDWTTAKWPAVTVPAVDGYMASQSQVPAVTVESTTDNQTVTVDYQSVEVPTTSPEARPTATTHTSGAKSAVTPAMHVKVASPSAAATPAVSAAKASQLPQTGTDKVVSTIMTSLGLLMGALSAFVLGRKQKGKGRKA